MKLFTFRSIRSRFLVPTIVLLVVIFGTLGTTLIIQNQRFADGMMNARAEAMANFLGKVGSGYINYFNLLELDNLVDQATKDKDTVYAAFYDPNGKLLTQKDNFPPEPKEDPSLVTYQREFTDDDGQLTGSMKLIYSRKSVEENARQSILFVVAGIIVAVTLFVIGMVLLTNSIVNPIQQLTRVTEEVVRSGDLRQTINIVSQDEIGKLAATFSQMVEKLREIPSSLQLSVATLGRSVEELYTNAEDQERTVTYQVTALQQTQVTANEIRQTSAVAAEKAAAVLEVAQRAEQVGRAGEVAIEQSLTGLTEIRAEVEEIAKKINELGDATRQIGGITETVKDLADQSNMLALNAAIEAMRSGEAGKGFAVVAREIRSLADQSINATNRVREILDNIGSATQRAVAITEKGAARMEAGLVEVRSSGESLRELSTIVKDNSAMVRQIAAAVNQQNAGVTQIFTAVTDLSKLTDQTVERLRSTNRAAANFKAASEQVAGVVSSFRI